MGKQRRQEETGDFLVWLGDRKGISLSPTPISPPPKFEINNAQNAGEMGGRREEKVSGFFLPFFPEIWKLPRFQLHSFWSSAQILPHKKCKNQNSLVGKIREKKFRSANEALSCAHSLCRFFFFAKMRRGERKKRRGKLA